MVKLHWQGWRWVPDDAESATTSRNRRRPDLLEWPQYTERCDLLWRTSLFMALFRHAEHAEQYPFSAVGRKWLGRVRGGPFRKPRVTDQLLTTTALSRRSCRSR